MTELLAWPAIFLLASLWLGMARVLRGPSDSDRMLGAQLTGTTGVGLLLILSKAMRMPALLDVALVLALLAAITVVAFVQSQGSEKDTLS